ncbi:MAG: MFS transporter [SAR202 cluster bacterium]|nr:MFS transporter [SAR202 cluster bacterium]|tara:strand:+ start:4153 stop:5394 length:1242 start_codon:yes stop_codon:yes gene_type:complete
MILLVHLKNRSTILFSALNNRNYRWYWFAAFFSSMSTGVNLITQGWLVLEMTNDPLWVGILAGINGIAQISFGTLGGVIVDRWNKRITIIILQIFSGIIGLILSLLLIYNHLDLWHLAIAAMFNGILQSVRIPTGNSIVFSIVGSKSILNALASQLIGFNTSRMIGSILAGTVISVFGTEYSYLLVMLSSLTAAILFFFMGGSYESIVTKDSFWKSLIEGIKFSWNDKTILLLLLISALIELFGFSFFIMLPIIAKEILGLNAQGLGYLSAANALGSTISTILVASLGDFKYKPHLLLVSALCVGVSLTVFAFTEFIILSFILSFIIGAFLMSYDASMGSLLQLLCTNEIRGRVLGIYGLTFGFTTLGGFFLGAISSLFSPAMALGISGISIVTTIPFVQSRIRKNTRFYTES